jgi:hypothetical protein
MIVTHLLALLFFSFVLGLAVAAIWSVLAEDWALVRANLPWRTVGKAEQRPQPVLLRHPFDQRAHA